MYDVHECRVKKKLLSRNNKVFTLPHCLLVHFDKFVYRQTQAWFKTHFSLGNPNRNEHRRTKDFPHKYQPANSRRISSRRFSPIFGGREATTGNASAVCRLHKYKIQPNLKNAMLCVNIDNLHHKMKKFTSNTMYFP